MKKKRVLANNRMRFSAIFKETIGELRKVTWPTRREAANLTIIVIIVTFAMSALLGILDFIYTRIFSIILG